MLKRVWKNYKFPIILLSSIFIGCILGIILKEDAVYLKTSWNNIHKYALCSSSATCIFYYFE